MIGKVEAVWIKRAHQLPTDPVDAAFAKAGSGLEGNANQGGRRQVTLMSTTAWDSAQHQLELSLDPGIRRANILVSGIDLEKTRGKTLTIGAVSILIHGETQPCDLMEEACPGLRDALTPHWRGGAYGEVMADGEIRVGDSVRWEESST